MSPNDALQRDLAQVRAFEEWHMTIKTVDDGPWGWYAIDADYYDPFGNEWERLRGCGRTEQEAIDDYEGMLEDLNYEKAHPL